MRKSTRHPHPLPRIEFLTYAPGTGHSDQATAAKKTAMPAYSRSVKSGCDPYRMAIFTGLLAGEPPGSCKVTS